MRAPQPGCGRGAAAAPAGKPPLPFLDLKSLRHQHRVDHIDKAIAPADLDAVAGAFIRE
jgi:hypothetical protein